MKARGTMKGVILTSAFLVLGLAASSSETPEVDDTKFPKTDHRQLVKQKNGTKLLELTETSKKIQDRDTVTDQNRQSERPPASGGTGKPGRGKRRDRHQATPSKFARGDRNKGRGDREKGREDIWY